LVLDARHAERRLSCSGRYYPLGDGARVSAGARLQGRDPLLATVRFILGISMAAMLAIAAGLLLAAPVILVWREQVVAQLAGHGAPPETIWGIVVLLVLSASLAVLGFYFARHLYRIIGTVGEGDPFVPVNADRLRAMAWISVGVHGVAVPMAILGNWVRHVTHAMHFKADLPLSGLFLALVLFILARVFREGTRMREDLEGTV
jgi:hypothetical protein